MTIYLIAAVLLLIFMLILISASRGVPHPANKLKTPLLDLLRKGYDSGYLKIRTDILSKKFLLIRKYIRDDNNFGLQFSFPQYNKLYFGEVEEFCRSRGMKYEIKDDFLIIDFEKDWIGLGTFCEEIFLDIFDVLAEDRVYTVLKNISPEIIHRVKHLKKEY